MKQLKEELILVRPINEKRVIELILQSYDLKEGDKIKVENCALVSINVMTDNECCYWFLEKKLINKNAEYVFSCAVRIERKTKNGYSFPMMPSFHFDISQSQFDECFLDEVSLKEFMGSRYNYNPRIETNMKSFIKEVGSYLLKQN